MDEFSWIAVLGDALGEFSPPVPYGMGDDAALLPSKAEHRVIAADMMTEGVHFRRDWSSLADIAFKLYASNASDMWAMGAAPAQWLLSIGFPDAPDAHTADGLAEGFLSAMSTWGNAELIGGDTTRAQVLTLSVTMIGVCENLPWMRADFQRGDTLWVDGPLGLSAAGLSILEQGLPFEDTHRASCVRQHLRPQRLSSEMPSLVRGAIDVSDGLTADLMHAATASGVRMVVNRPLPGWEHLHAVAKGMGVAADDLVAQREAWQLGGGEDYVRVIGAPESPGKGWTAIGAVEEGPPSVFDERSGERQELTPMGWNHFRSPPSST